MDEQWVVLEWNVYWGEDVDHHRVLGPYSEQEAEEVRTRLTACRGGSIFTLMRLEEEPADGS